jgi:RNA polymerase Rpb4
LISLNEEEVLERSQLRFKVIIAAAINGMPPKRRKKNERKLITNAEVLETLRAQTPAVKRNKKKGATHCEWIRDQVSDFLYKSSNSSSGGGERSRPLPRPDLFAVLPDTLTQQEKLQLVNILPTELVELFLIIDNLNDRFTESQQEQLLALIQSEAPTTTSTEHDVVVAAPDETSLDVKMEPADAEIELEPNNVMGADPSPTSQATPDTIMSVSPSEDYVEMTPMDPVLGMKHVNTKHVLDGGHLASMLESA